MNTLMMLVIESKSLWLAIGYAPMLVSYDSLRYDMEVNCRYLDTSTTIDLMEYKVRTLHTYLPTEPTYVLLISVQSFTSDIIESGEQVFFSPALHLRESQPYDFFPVCELH